MTGIQRVMNKCLHFLQLEERAKADGDPERARRARVMYRATKLQLNAMRVRRSKLKDLYEQHDLHKYGVNPDEFAGVVEVSLQGLEAPNVSSTESQGGGYSASEQIV